MEECKQHCTWGAVYGQEYSGERPKLFCTNQKHYAEKVERGKAAWGEAVRERMGKEAEEDQAAVQGIVSADQRTLFHSFALALMAEQSYHQVVMPGGWDEKELWYEHGTSARVRELLGIDADLDRRGNSTSSSVSFVRGYGGGAVDAELVAKLEVLELPDLQELTANLIAYTLRQHQPEPGDEDEYGGGDGDEDGDEDGVGAE